MSKKRRGRKNSKEQRPSMRVHLGWIWKNPCREDLPREGNSRRLEGMSAAVLPPEYVKMHGRLQVDPVLR